ncbi:MAG: PD-(D/E)XK nuclease family protein [Puniceicoccales bacterium]|jgi:hypothetical protein|nr:PD-(D/E)XK nuclease family protein [Puniceicoccales bacterium]
MATYVIENFSNFINEIPHIFHSSEVIFVIPTYDDIWSLKIILSQNKVQTRSIKFYTAHEFRKYLAVEFDLPKKICTNGMVSFCFDEVSDGMSASGYTQRTIIADKKATLQAFHETLWSGLQCENILGEDLCAFFKDLKKEIASNDFILEQDVDRLLLESASYCKTSMAGQVIFYGFLPFDSAKVLMEAAAKCYAQTDAITYDFGDAEFVHLWTNTLERIFGESTFYLCNGDRDFGGNIKFQAYDTICDEVETTFNQILQLLSRDTSVKIGVCFKDNQTIQLPMLVDKLEAAGLSYYNTIGHPKKSAKHETILSLWGDWQIRRDIPSFCRFCAELSTNNLIEREQFDKIIGDLPSLQGGCLSDNFDVVLEFANVKNIHSFDIVEPYDMHGAKFSFKNFHQKFAKAFGDILPPEMVEFLVEQSNGPIAERVFSKRNLVKYFVASATSKNQDYTLNPQANIVLININSAYKQDFTDIFVVGMTAADFDFSGENYWLPTNIIDRINNRTTIRLNSGDPAVKHSHNYLLTSQEKKHLQRTIFEILCKKCKLTLSYAIKNHSSDSVEQEPAKVFTEIFRLVQKEFYSKDQEDLLLEFIPDTLTRFSDDSLSSEDIESMEKCTTSYTTRHDLSQNIHDYCFAIDPTLKLSCSTLERILQKPCTGFYDFVLKLPMMPWYSKPFDKKIALGSFTHEFLQIFEAKSIFIRKHSPDIFYGNIRSRSSRMKSMMARACAAADTDVPANFSRTVDLATIWAKRLVDKLFAIPSWESFRSEYSLPSDLTVKIKDEGLCLSGRLDFVISNGNPHDANHFDTDTVIIDFKTGSNVEMTERNVKWHMERYSGLQLLLYGIALKTLGFKTVGILMLKPDSSIANTSIDIDYILEQVPELLEKLSQTICTGLIERQILGKIFRQFVIKDVPLATTDLY